MLCIYMLGTYRGFYAWFVFSCVYHVIENRFVHILELAKVFWGVARVFCMVARVFSVANKMIWVVVNVFCVVAMLFLIVVL